MDPNDRPRPFRTLVDALRENRIARRQFLERSTALGISFGMATYIANATHVATKGQTQRNGFVFYQGADGTPSASPVADVVELIPDVGMEDVIPGEGGELRIIQWQAATSAFAHTATGTKDYLISDMILQPLARYLPDGTIIPYLATQVPSVENGLLAEALSTATWKLKEGIAWSDGEPFTSRDVQFTWEWIVNPDNASVSFAVWDVIESVDTPDDLTAVVTYKVPAANWFEPFVGGETGPIMPAHVYGGDPTSRNVPFDTAPIGTGPYKIDSFIPNDRVVLSMNENYWERNAPYFSTVIVKGGGDAASAARAVLQTGEYQYAWNLQVEPAVLEQMLASESRGEVKTVQGTDLERIHFQFADPNTEVDGQFSHLGTPHPFLTERAVRQAMNKAVDRETIAREFYGEGQPATANLLNGLESFTSPNTTWEFDLEEAAQLLEDAGWTMQNGVRAKDGVELTVRYATSVNQVRQKTQQVVKASLEQIGFAVQLAQIEAGIFFGGEPGNTQNINHFYWNLAMWTSGPSSPVPTSFLETWYAGPNDSVENVAQESNQWQGQNFQRYVNEDYDALFEELLRTTDLERANEVLISMNDLLIEDVVIIPEVNRAADKYAIALELEDANVAMSSFELNYWNIANWVRRDG